MEVFVHAHVGGLAGSLLGDVEFVFFSIESGDLLDGPDLRFCYVVRNSALVKARQSGLPSLPRCLTKNLFLTRRL